MTTFIRRLSEYGFGIAFVLLILAIFAHYMIDRHEMVGRSRAVAGLWNVSGPPCQAISRAEFARMGAYVPEGMLVWNARIERRRGEGRCMMASPDYWEGHDFLSCRFENPFLLRVLRDDREWLFFTGETAATLSVRDGDVRCVAR